MVVIKRDGTIEPFDIEKVQKAVHSAFCAVGMSMPPYLTNMISSLFSQLEGDTIGIEEIQDKVETILMNDKFFEVAKAYILYRESHKKARFIKDRIDYMNKYSQSNENAATSSETDDNANITQKNVAILETEVYKTTNRVIQRQRMKDKLNEIYPEVAKQYTKDIDHHIIYIHDEASTPVLKNYCMAVSLYPLVEKGSSSLDGLNTSTPKNLNSFCGQLTNAIFILSSQCKGAVGIGEFFNFFDYYCAKEWGEDYYKRDSAFADSEECLNRKTIGQKIEQYFQQVVYTLNQPQNNRGQSPFTNINYFDSYYWKALFEDFCFPDGSKPVWERVNYLQKKFMKWFNKERAKTLCTFPVESMCLLHDGNDILDKEYKDFVAEMYSEGHSFFTYISDNPDAVASCCRLRNEVSQNTFSSTTGLTGVQTGSCNVITLNLNRITQDYFKSFIHPDDYNRREIEENWKEALCKKYFKEYLVNILKRVYKYHIAFKTMLYEVEEQGMLASSKAGYISMSKLYCTIGVNGVNEAAEFLGLTVGNNAEYKEFVSFVFNIIKENNTKYSTPKFRFNLEIVPAESLGIKNYNFDKEDGYWVPTDRNLYNSYIYNAHDDTSVLDKFKLQGGDIAKSCDGGQAVHANLEDHLSKEQYIKLLEIAVKEGTNYFTFNIPNSQCDNCGFITKHPITECPKCHSNRITQWTRVIGYLRPIKAFSKGRQIEAAKRTYNNAKIC